MDDRLFCLGLAGEELAEIVGLAHLTALHGSRPVAAKTEQQCPSTPADVNGRLAAAPLGDPRARRD